MTELENISVVADLIFGLAMLVYGFAGGLFVAGWALKRSMKCEVRSAKSEDRCHLTPALSPNGGEGEERTGHQRRPDETRISQINPKGEPDEPSGK